MLEDDDYWEPADNINELSQQLYSKKYREIERQQLEYVRDSDCPNCQYVYSSYSLSLHDRVRVFLLATTTLEKGDLINTLCS